MSNSSRNHWVGELSGLQAICVEVRNWDMAIYLKVY